MQLSMVGGSSNCKTGLFKIDMQKFVEERLFQLSWRKVGVVKDDLMQPVKK